MKFVVKQLVIAAAAALLVTTSAYAADTSESPRMPTKGTKSYQSAHRASPVEQGLTTADVATTETDVQNIAPAAGDTEDKADNGKSFKEELRLPRKN